MVFVRYETPEGAARAMRDLNKKKILDKVLVVEWAKDENEKLEDQWRKT
jgi:RNA recognition motif-containing protein